MKFLLKAFISIIFIFTFNTTFVHASPWTSIKTNGLPEYPSKVIADEHGEKWITTDVYNAAGVYQWLQDGTLKYYSKNDKNKQLAAGVNCVYRDISGNTWYGLWGKGLKKESVDGQWTIYTSENTNYTLPDNNIIRLRGDRLGGLWVVTLKGAVYMDKYGKLLNTDIYSIYEANGLGIGTQITIHDFLKDSQGRVWIAGQNGLYTNYGDTQQIKKASDIFTDINFPGNGSGGEISRIEEDKEGNVWFTSSLYGAGGVYCFTKESKWIYYTKDNTTGMPRNQINDLTIDKNSGDIWFGGYYGGLSTYSKINGWRSYSKEQLGLQSGDVISVSVDDTGTVWFVTGSEAGIGMGVHKLTFDKENKPVVKSFNHMNTSTTLTSNRIRFVAVDKTDGKWFGSDDNGVSRLKADGTWIQYYAGQNGVTLGSNAIGGITVDSENKVYFALINHKPAAYDVNTDKWIELPDPPIVSYSYGAYTDSKDTKYFYLYDGLLCLDKDNKWKLYTVENTNGALPDNQVYDVLEDKDGTLWVGTRHGIAKMNKDGTWKGYVQNDKSGFKYDSVNKIKLDNLGKIWVGNQNYDSSLDKWVDSSQEGGYSIKMPNEDEWSGTTLKKKDGTTIEYTYDNTDGIVSNNMFGLMDIAADSKGNIYFVYLDGVSVYNGENVSTSLDDKNYRIWQSSNAEKISSEKEWTIKFNRKVDEASLNSNIIIKNVETDSLVALDFETIFDSSKNTTTVNVKHRIPFEVGKTYVLYIKPDITTQNGIMKIKQGSKMTFKVDFTF